MNYTEFKEELIEKIEERTGESVINKKITKNNNVILDSIILQKNDKKASPTIYLKYFFEDFQDGKSIDEIVAEILQLDEENCDTGFEEVLNGFLCFDKIQNRILYKLVNYEKNAEILQKIPHRKFLDLALVYMVVGFEEQHGMATILINHFHTKTWQVTEEKLYEVAKENTPKMLPYTIKDMHTILTEMELLAGFSDEEMHELLGEYVPMYVLTNKYKNFGAACILYEGVLEEIKKVVGGGFYILPSSVHELIIVKSDGKNEPDYLRKMVREVNSTAVGEEEFLADSVYRYCNGKVEKS